MKLWQLVLLSAVQGLAELLPVSSSAHVIVAEKLIGLNASTPQMTMLLVMLHTGTMFAVIVYFWRDWVRLYFSSWQAFKDAAIVVIVASVFTAIVGEGLIHLIEHALAKHGGKAQVEDLFSHLEVIAPALFAVGVFIIAAHVWQRQPEAAEKTPNAKQATLIGIVQGIAIPFRGFSRSGSTISAGLVSGTDRRRAEAFSFALAVVVTPAAIYRELHRLVGHASVRDAAPAIGTSVIGMVCAFIAGLIALKWLSAWLESGRWYIFGAYCIVFSGIVFALWRMGF